MKLELGFIEIKDIQFSKESKLENGILFVNADEAKNFVFGDDDVKACVKDAHFDIAKPGESVRITPVKDVIEPRVKVEGPGGEFPGSHRQGRHRRLRQDSCAPRHGSRYRR